MLDESIKESKNDGLYYLPQNFGDILTGKISINDPKIEEIVRPFRKHVQEVKQEGVTDEDVRFWLNLHEVERRIVAKVDDFNRLPVFIDELTKHGDPKRAMDQVRKWHPIYGVPKDTIYIQIQKV